MRWCLAFAMLASPVSAWEFRAEPICVLEHSEPSSEIAVTFDLDQRLYSIDLTLTEGTWPDAELFGMLFAGPQQIQIATERHMILNGGKTLRVTDTGFGNVLDGLEFNERAFAKAGEQTLVFSLLDAGPAVAAFRSCTAALSI